MTGTQASEDKQRFPERKTSLRRPASSTTASAGLKSSNTRRFDRRNMAIRSGTKTTPTTPSAATAHAEFTFRSSPTSSGMAAQQQQQQQPQQQKLESVGAALLPSLTRRATVTEAKSRQAGTMRRRTKELALADASVTRSNTRKKRASLVLAEEPVGVRNTYEIPNDNENDGQYAMEFWLNALVAKPHTNFFGYESSIGPICISISTRESHECYKALVRTPFKFGVVFVPTMVIDEPIFGTDLDRLSSPTPQKILLYHALRIYFQQADEERRGYLITALRNLRLTTENASRVDAMAAKSADSGLWEQTPLASATVGAAATAVAAARQSVIGSKRSTELRREEINNFMDSLFDTDRAPAIEPRREPVRERRPAIDTANAATDPVLKAQIDVFLANERYARDLAVATESLTELRDEHLKPLLRSLEPKLYRRRLRIDFVVVGAQDHAQIAGTGAPHRRFLRTLERASARMRGDGEAAKTDDASSSAAGSASGAEITASAAAAASSTAGHGTQKGKMKRRQKTKAELDAKRDNVIAELISTERSYVAKLRALIDIYAVPLRSAARSANNTLIPAYDAHVIFGNIERVHEVNERFLGDLEAWQRGEMDPKETIGSLCRDHFVDFHVYKRYINGYHHALESSRALEAKSASYAGFLLKARERDECRKLGLSDLLIMPVQRIPRYTLLLTDLLKVVAPDNPDAQRIQAALERINEIGQLADNQIAESVTELHRIQTTVDGCPPNLISASRAFIGAVDASELDLTTGKPKRPMSLLVFSDLLMVVERYWPPKGHGGIRVTCGRSTKAACPVHGSAAKKSAGTGPAGAGVTCTCGSDNGLSAATTAFMASGAVGTTKWGRFAGWIDISRISVLEKSVEPAATAFYILRYPTNDEPSALDPREARRTRVGTASGKSGASMVSLDSAASSSSSNTITTPPAAAASRNSGSGGRGRTAEDPMQIEFSRILYPSETTESYGDAAYWHPQSLHEFEVDSPMTRDALFEFLNTAWDRSVARCFEATGGLSRHGSSSSRNGGAIVRRPVASLGHPELDRVDVGGQSWAVRIWDAADYARTRHDCPNALMADLTVVWDYSVSNSSDGSDMSVYYPFQACRVADRGDEWFDVTSTVLPLDAQNGAAAGDAYAELSEECETVDSWPELCRLVEQAIVMYQYVLLAYPEHHRVQQCYNRSILASLFDRNALGSSSAVKNEAVAAAPRKLFSRAKHLFSTSLRGSSSHRETLDTANLFASAYGTQQPVDPATHGTHHASSTMFGKYRSKGKGSTMTSTGGVTLRSNTTLLSHSNHQKQPSAGATLPRPATSLQTRPLTPSKSSSSSKGFVFSAGMAGHVRTASAATVKESTHRTGIFARSSADQLSSSSIGGGSGGRESMIVRERAQTSRESRGRTSSNASSSHSSPLQRLSRVFSTQSTNGYGSFAGSLSSLPVGLSGSSPSLAKLNESADRTRSAEEVGIKRRSMSVVSRGDLKPDDGLSSSSVFSLKLDFDGDNLGIPDDLKLEFDQALSNVGHETPPNQELTVDLSSITRDAFPIPSASAGGDGSMSACQSWDVRSPEDDNAPKSANVLSKTSSGVSSSAQSVASKSLGRRQGIYGITLPSTSASSSPPPLPISGGGPLSPTPIMLRESDILIDIARELSEDGPSGDTAVQQKQQQQPESPCYIDDADIAKHMSSMTVTDYRPLPPVPFSPMAQQHRQQQQQQHPPVARHLTLQAPKTSYPQAVPGMVRRVETIAAPPPASADYPRLPSLPPRIRSSAYMSRASAATVDSPTVPKHF